MIKKRTLEDKISDVVFDDVCIEKTLNAMIKNYKAWGRELKEGFPEDVENNKKMITLLEGCLKQNIKIQKRFRQ